MKDYFQSFAFDSSPDILHFIPLSTILCRVLLDRRSNQHLPWLMVYAYRMSGKHRDFSYHTLMNYLTSSPGASMKIDRHFFERGSCNTRCPKNKISLSLDRRWINDGTKAFPTADTDSINFLPREKIVLDLSNLSLTCY